MTNRTALHPPAPPLRPRGGPPADELAQAWRALAVALSDASARLKQGLPVTEAERGAEREARAWLAALGVGWGPGVGGGGP